MADTDIPADSSPPAPRPRRSANTIEATPDRARASRPQSSEEQEAPDQPGGASHRAGDVPARLHRRYFTEALRFGAIDFYEGPGAKRRAFTDHGSRLVTDQTHPAVARDFAAIAAHRGWVGLRVKGEDDFRRQMWLEARALGLDVKGYRPTERDRQELERHTQTARSPGRNADGPRRNDPDEQAPLGGREQPRAVQTPGYDHGVSGRFMEAGEAPYRGRTGGAATPFLRIERSDGRPLDIWGAGLPAALARSGAREGDVIHVRRAGVEIVQRTVEVRDPDTGDLTPQVRETRRNRWVIQAERFRLATPAQAARDETLRGAQSHLRVLDCAIAAAVQDPQRRARLQSEARELIAEEIAQGRRFRPARIREIEPQLAPDRAGAALREAAPERALRR